MKIMDGSTELEKGEPLEDVVDPHNQVTALRQQSIMRARRTSVSAESITPLKRGNGKGGKVPKTEEEKKSICMCVKDNFLFRNLSEEQYEEVINSMILIKVKKGVDIIKQNDIGDYFYAVQSGAFDVFISKDGGEPQKVTSYTSGGTFGELALMYNAPRSATVTATEDSVVWALDRFTFRSIVLRSAYQKRNMYKDFLEEVPLLNFLDASEKHKIADALESVTYNQGDRVIVQGDIGENFYIIEDGSVTVLYKGDDGVEKEIGILKKGDYFGELALINEKPRAATIVARERLKCLTMGKQAFQRLFGPIVNIIKRKASTYSTSPMADFPLNP